MMQTTQQRAGFASTTFTFSSTPRALEGSRAGVGPRFRDPVKSAMVADTRVRAHPGLMFVGRNATGMAEQGQHSRTRRYTTTAKAAASAGLPAQDAGVPPVEGRTHIDVQTEPYLEELADRPSEASAETQTEAFLDRPPSPLFVPRKTGVDAETQVLAGELFDFDVEVEPVLEVLVGKALDQALTEVAEEDEAASLRARQETHARARAAELAEVQRLEEAEARREEEKMRRLEQERLRVEAQRQAQSQAALRNIARSYVADFTKAVFNDLKRGGFFHDAREREVEGQFVGTWLSEQVDEAASQSATSRQVVDALIQAALTKAVLSFKPVNGGAGAASEAAAGSGSPAAALPLAASPEASPLVEVASS